MPNFQQKITRNIRKQENMAHSKKQNKSPETIIEKTITDFCCVYKNLQS